MKITYLIGNGFDLHFGLKTRYTDFYNYYVRQKCAYKKIRYLKGKLICNKSMWSDLEKTLGKLTQESSNTKEYIDFIGDMYRSLAEFLKIEMQQFVIEEQRKQKVLNDMAHFDRYFINSNVQRKVYDIMHCAEEYEVKFIVYNYTDTLEKIIANDTVLTRVRCPSNSRYYNVNSGGIIHVHGTLERQMVFGVNDASQILNEDFAKNTEFLNSIIKPLMNKNSQTFRDEQATMAINNSDIICIYGMSIGETDKVWWEAIGKHLATSEAKLIIFDIPSSVSPLLDFSLPEYEAKKSRFKDMTALDDNSKNIISDRIFVCLSNDIF